MKSRTICNSFESFEGGTRATHNLDIRLGGLMKLVEAIVAMSMKQEKKKGFARVKELLESNWGNMITKIV